MEENEEKENDASDSLYQVEPVTRVRISQIIWPGFNRNHQPVDGVIDERYKDAADLDEEYVGDRLEIAYRVVKIGRAGQRL